MTTVSGTFVANGASTVLAMGKTEKDLIFSVTGPFDGRVALQEGSSDESGWQSIVEKLDSRSSLVQTFKSKKDAKYRVVLRDTVADVTNGAFASDASWTKGTGWTIASGVADATGAISTALTQAVSGLVPGASYVVTVTTTRDAGGLLISLGGGTAGTEITDADTHSQTIVAGSTNSLLAFTGNGFTGTIDDVSITPSIAYSLADAVAVVELLKNAEGATMRTVTSDGAETIPGTLAVTGAITATGGVVGNVAGVVTPTADAITEAGAASVTTGYTSIVGTFELTLAAPTIPGLVKVISMIGAGGSVTLALTNVVGGSQATTATFDAAGETLVLVAHASKWVVLKEQGVTLT